MSGFDMHLPILHVIVPLFGAVLTGFCRRGTTAWGIALISTWAAFAVAVMLAFQVAGSPEPLSYVMGGWGVPWGIEYRIDGLNAFVLVVVTGVGAAIMPYARKSVAMEIDSHQQAWFYTMYLLCLAGLLGIAATGDAFNVFVFMEISSLATYVMIALGRHRRALLASYQYLIIGTIGATLYVIGIGLLYVVTGTLNLADIAQRLGDASATYERPVIAALAFLTVGICLKLALFPLHVWLPNAYAYAPSFATVFLAGTATKVAIYLLVRIFYSVFGPTFSLKLLHFGDVLIVLSIAAMVLASLTAIFENNVKRMLAYSSVAQIGYITLGIALVNQAGLTGGLTHLFNHAVMKSALFLAVGAMVYRLETSDIGTLQGIGRKLPWSTAAFVVGGLGLIGVPGTAGFVSKWYLVLGAMERGSWSIVFAIVASSVLAVVYVGKFIEAAYFREPSPAIANLHEPPISMLVPTLVLAAATVYFGLDTRASAGLASVVASQLLGGAP